MSHLFFWRPEWLTNLPPQFTAPDLSEIARKLDETEHGYLEEEAGAAAATSTNMDDTGA